MNAGRRILDPIDRDAEVLFGPFMVLSFTGTTNVASAGARLIRDELGDAAAALEVVVIAPGG